MTASTKLIDHPPIPWTSPGFRTQATQLTASNLLVQMDTPVADQILSPAQPLPPSQHVQLLKAYPPLLTPPLVHYCGHQTTTTSTSTSPPLLKSIQSTQVCSSCCCHAPDRRMLLDTVADAQGLLVRGTRLLPLQGGTWWLPETTTFFICLHLQKPKIEAGRLCLIGHSRMLIALMAA